MTALATTAAACVAFASAGAGGYLLSRELLDSFTKYTRASAELAGTMRSRLLLQARKGVPCIDGLSRRLVGSVPLVDETSDRICAYLAESGIEMRRETVVSVLILFSLAVGCIGWAITGSVCFGAALGAACMLGAMLAVKNWGEKRDMDMREQVPEIIRSIEMSFRSGRSLPQTLSASAEECRGYLGHLFEVSSDRLKMGSSTSEALEAMCNNRRVPELSFIAVALDIQHRSGGSIGPVLESAMDTVQGELKLMRNLRIQTAQAKLSAIIVTIMPFLLIALFSMMSPDFLSPFFSSLTGMAVLVFALAMQAAGVFLVRRMLKVQVA